eukprot:Gb_11016 [translate_table: standard]
MEKCLMFLKVNTQQQYNEVTSLKQQVEQLQKKQKHMMGEQITDLSVEDLQKLEHQLHEAIHCVRARKDQLVLDQLEEVQKREQHLIEENESLHKQLEEVQKSLPTTERQIAAYLEFQPLESRDFSAKHVVTRPVAVHNPSFEDSEPSDTSLHLG